MKERIIVMGDTHGRSFWKLVKEKEEWTKFIFIGDYFDSFDIVVGEQMTNFREIAKFKEENPDKVVLLIGNHDEHYFPFMGDSGTSGYNAGAAPLYGHLLMTNKDLLQMAHSEGNVLFSHAGISEVWLENNSPFKEEGEFKLAEKAEEIARLVNNIWKYKPLSFKFVSTGWDPYGDDIFQTPIWIRPQSLFQSTENIRKSGIIQVVGHTTMQKINSPKGPEESNIWFIDTLGTSGEYLIIEDGEFKTGKV